MTRSSYIALPRMIMILFAYEGSPQDKKPSRRDCGSVPVAPPGVSVDAKINIGLYKRGNVRPLRSASDMIRMFRTGGSMDYKTRGEQYVDFGKFNYGSQ